VQVIHFTEGATDPLIEPRAQAARFVEIAEGSGESHLGCLHMAAGGNLPRRSMPRDSALLTVHGNITVIADSGLRLDILTGVGVILSAEENFTLERDTGGAMVLIQCEHLKPLEGRISTPERIRGQQWPGHPPASRHSEPLIESPR
jgi:hypothetical protein